MIFIRGKFVSELGDVYTRMSLSSFCEVHHKDGSIWAIPYNDCENEMMIHVVSRLLGEKESNTVRVTAKSIQNLVYKTNNMVEPNIPCIAFVVFKRSLQDCEVVIAPIDEIRKNSTPGGVFASTENGLFYDYSKLSSSEEKPTGAILRSFFKCSVQL